MTLSGLWGKIQKPTHEELVVQDQKCVQILSELIDQGQKLNPKEAFSVGVGGDDPKQYTLDQAMADIMSEVRSRTKKTARELKEGRSHLQKQPMYAFERTLEPLMQAAVTLRQAIIAVGGTNGDGTDFRCPNEAYEALGQYEANLLQYEEDIVQCFDEWAQAVEEHVPADQIKMPLASNHQDSVDYHRDQSRIRGVDDLTSQTHDHKVMPNDYVEMKAITPSCDLSLGK